MGVSSANKYTSEKVKIVMRKNRTKVIAKRSTTSLAMMIEENMHISPSVSPTDFLMDAVREKLKKDVFEQYQGGLKLDEMGVQDLAFKRVVKGE